MELTAEVLSQLSPKSKMSIKVGIVNNQHLLEEAEITPGLRRQHFLAQLAHESDGFWTTREYASGKAYEGRLDLGNTEEGDGVRFKGRGLIQLTGRANYQAFNRVAEEINVLENPEKVEEFPYALQAATWYWTRKNLNRYADADDIITLTRRINGGVNGLADREEYLNRAKEMGL